MSKKQQSSGELIRQAQDIEYPIPDRYAFTAYDNPVKAVYKVETGEYKFPVGWVQKEVTDLVVGETTDCYVYYFLKTESDDWTKTKMTLPMGFHKSRLVRWETTQLQLIN